jgi:hypothetical protein
MEIGGLLGVFLGGALPWLEAVVVVPAGILAGLDPVLVVLSGLSGNMLTVALAAVYGERLRLWWMARRGGAAPAPDGRPHATPDGRSRGRRAQVVMQRWGMPGLALLGPIGLGTQLSAVLAVSMGVSARRTLAWIGAGTTAWCVVAAALAGAGMSFAGVGA